MDVGRSGPGPLDGSLLTLQSVHRSQVVWDNVEAGTVQARQGFDYSLYRETHTFHMPFGEATITLEDVHHILGLPTEGDPLILRGASTTVEERRVLVREFLGLLPEAKDDVNRGGLKIKWLVDNFGSCERLEQLDPEDIGYGVQVTYHIRAHLLCVIGSLFPHSSGNRVQLDLLWLLRDMDQLRRYSWGSAVLGFLYQKLCSSSRDNLWIYERFPSLAPRHRGQPLFEYPLALRWKAPLRRCQVPHAQSRMTQYELDALTPRQFRWRPYADLPAEHHPEATVYLRWTAPAPMMYMSYVEWCYTDRVTRQFGFMQGVPYSSPYPNHQELHDHYNEQVDWMYAREPFVDLWDTRMERALASPPLMHGEGCTASYLPWFHRVTRRIIINPLHWPQQEGAFQGTQLSTQELEEQLSAMQRAIDPYAPDLGLANHILQDMVTRVQRRPTEQAPARPRARAPAGRRGRPPVTPVVPEEGTYYTHVGSSHLAGTSHSAGHDGAGTFEAGGWSPFIQPSTSEGVPWPQRSRLGDDEAQDDEGPSQDHLSESYVYRPDMSFLEDHTPPPFTQDPSFGSSTYRFGSPPVTFTPMMSTSGQGFTTPLPAFAAFAGDSSPWAYAPVRPPRAAAQPSEVEDESDDEEPSEHEQRQQPPRAAKGKGRRCHTGSHFFGHTKK
nr:PREDICTED: serine/threonine-protein phosphatase 7 long form homolog [Daucus carota subsp. sativus]